MLCGALFGGEDRFVFWFIYEEQVKIEQEENQTRADAGRVKEQVKEDDMDAQRGQKNQGQSNPPARHESQAEDDLQTSDKREKITGMIESAE